VNIQSVVKFNNVYWYALEPGDGTRYQFGIINFQYSFETGFRFESEKTDTKVNDYFVRTPVSYREGDSGVVFQGIGSGRDYVLVIVDMPSGQGVYPIMKQALLEIDRHTVNYYKGHTNDRMMSSTIAAILLAVSVLWQDPNNIQGALEEMLRWPEIFKE